MNHPTARVENALITDVRLGIEDHGILTCHLGLKYRIGCQSFGGYSFDQYDEPEKQRLGTSYGMEFIRRILDVVGVDNWEDLKGKHIRALQDHSKVYAIGHFLEDKWFNPQEDLKKFIK